MCGNDATTNIILGRRLNQSQGKNPKNKIGITTTVCKCKQCGLIYSNPQPIPFDIQDHYGVLPEVYWENDYINVPDNYFTPEIELLKTLLEFKEGRKSLDIGAGLGHQMISLSKFGFEAYGIESSNPFYERAIKQMKISPDRLKLGMIENVDYPENFFDFISFGAVLEHLYDPSESLEKALKWLAPGGIIHIEVPSSNWLIGKIINLFYKLKLTDYVGNLSPMHPPYHLYEFSLQSFQAHAKRNNYEIAFYQYYVSQTYMPKITDFVLKSFMRKTNTGMQLCVWLRKNK